MLKSVRIPMTVSSLGVVLGIILGEKRLISEPTALVPSFEKSIMPAGLGIAEAQNNTAVQNAETDSRRFMVQLLFR
jgi:hypothetical protein